MTSSELARRAHRIVADMLRLLDDRTLAHLVDAPIDRAAASFDIPAETVASQAEFLQIVGAFLQHLARQLAGRRLQSWQSRAEAIALLDEAYRASHASGYYGALWDAVDPAAAGLPAVLAVLTEHLKARHRQAHVRWALTRAIDPADWPLRLAVIEAILDRWKSYLPRELQSCSAEQLVEMPLDLLLMDQDASRMLCRPGRLSPIPQMPTEPTPQTRLIA